MTDPATPAPPTRQPATGDASIAALVGAGFGLALLNTPATWMMAVLLLLVAIAIYGVLRIGLRRKRPVVLAENARTTHGVRVLVLFAVAFGITRLTPPEDLRTWYALGGAVVVGLGGYLVLRLEEAALLRQAATEQPQDG